MLVAERWSSLLKTTSNDGVHSTETTFQKSGFDIAYSDRVIEHFDHLEAMFQDHLDMARLGGCLVIFMSHCVGFWGQVQKRLDPECWAIHNAGMMNLSAMTRLMRAMKCKVIHIGYRDAYFTSIRSLVKPFYFQLANYVLKGRNVISTFLPPHIGKLAPQIVTVARKI